ncbi:hypothetical protein JNK13_05225 [bacterium]|nr:hypothetical protein [bacterium]
MDQVNLVKYLKIPRRIGFLDIVGALVILAAFKLKLGWFGDPGLGWHLKTGELIWQTQSLPATDPFLNPAVNAPWIIDQWLSDILLWLCYSVAGFSAVKIVAHFVVICSFVFILQKILVRETRNYILIGFVLLLVAAQASMSWFVRPVVFSFLCFACCYQLFAPRLALRPSGMKLKLLCQGVSTFLLFTLWANLHPSFALGFLIILAALISRILNRDFEAAKASSLLLGIALLATFVTPYGLDLHLTAFKLVQSDFFTKLNQEWLAPRMSESSFTIFYAALGFFALALLLTPRCKLLTSFDLVLCSPLLWEALNHRRFIPYFIFAFAPVMIRSGISIGSVFTKTLNRKLPLITSAFRSINAKEECGSKALLSLLALLGLYLPQCLSCHQRTEQVNPLDAFYPARAIEYVLKQKPERLFNHPDYGGYLIWRGFQPFIDDRNQLIGEERYRLFLQINQAKGNWLEKIAENKFTFLLLDRLSPAHRKLSTLGLTGFEKVYEDKKASVWRELP